MNIAIDVAGNCFGPQNQNFQRINDNITPSQLQKLHFLQLEVKFVIFCVVCQMFCSLLANFAVITAASFCKFANVSLVFQPLLFK